MISHFRMMAAYNGWANARLLAAVRLLTRAQYQEDRGAFFKSVYGTLNHLLVTDRIWLHRMTGTGDCPKRLDEILFEEFEPLAAAREREDGRLSGFVETLVAQDLDAMLRYSRASTSEVVESPLGPTLAHVFNHQTHHRGQIHALLTGLTGRAPELDLLFYQRAHPDVKTG